MNSTPPSAESTSSLVLIAVAPRYSPTRSARCASTTSGRLQQAEGVEDLGQHPGHGGLAGAGRAEEDEVPHRPLGADAGHRAPPRRLDGGGDRADLLLDRGQADHRVELGHRVLDRDRAGAAGGCRPDGRGRRARRRAPPLGAPSLEPAAADDRRAALAWIPPGAGVSRGSGRRLIRRGPVGLSRGSRGSAAVHAGVLYALGHPPAEYGRGQQPGRDRVVERLARRGLQGDDARGHGPGQDPGDGTARDEPAGQRPGVRGQRDEEGQQDHRVEPGPVVLVGEREHGQAPERYRATGRRPTVGRPGTTATIA